jgi:DNA-binding response OmpR family regulator
MSAASGPRASGTGYTILVVDDDPRIVELLHIALGAHGFRVISASNGEDALRQAFDELPDLVILDVRLPRRSGYEVCETIRREPQLAHLPVIMVSALTETEARLQGLARGADDYLPKPFSPKELIAKVKRALARAEELKGLQRRARELAGEVERSREETRRAQDELRREKLVQEAYSRLAQDLSRLHRSEEVASAFLFALMTHLGVQGAAMLLPDEGEAATLAPRLARGLAPEREALLRVPADGELARLLVALGRPVRREELERFPVLRDELDPLIAAGAALLVPLGTRGRLVGMAVLVEKANGGNFSGVDLEMAASLATAAALAVEQSGMVRHAEETYLRAARAYGDALEAQRPGARRRAEATADVAEAGARAGLRGHERSVAAAGGAGGGLERRPRRRRRSHRAARGGRVARGAGAGRRDPRGGAGLRGAGRAARSRRAGAAGSGAAHRRPARARRARRPAGARRTGAAGGGLRHAGGGALGG